MKLREFLLDASCENTTICISPVSHWNRWIEIHLDNNNNGTDACEVVPYDCLLDMEVGHWILYLGIDNRPTIEIELFMGEFEEWFLNLDEIQTMGKGA